MRVRHDDAGVDGEGLTSHDPFLHAARQHGLEQLAQKIALAKTAMAVLGNRRMIRNLAVEAQAAEPAVGQIEVNFLAQPTFGTNAQAIADDEHPNHQLGIDRRPPDVAIVGPQVRPQPREIDEPIDLAQHVTVGDMPLKTEAVEQRLLHHARLAHHRPNLLHPAEENQPPAPQSSGVFQHNPSIPDGYGGIMFTLNSGHVWTAPRGQGSL
jgi:hypothetical protein